MSSEFLKLYYKLNDIAAILKVEPDLLELWGREFYVKSHSVGDAIQLYGQDELTIFTTIKRLVLTEGRSLTEVRQLLNLNQPTTTLFPDDDLLSLKITGVKMPKNSRPLAKSQKLLNETKLILQEVKDILKPKNFRDNDFDDNE